MARENGAAGTDSGAARAFRCGNSSERCGDGVSSAKDGRSGLDSFEPAATVIAPFVAVLLDAPEPHIMAADCLVGPSA